ncbi:MAG: tetratricopeptide repeat protein [Pseudomonadota bacterium]
MTDKMTHESAEAIATEESPSVSGVPLPNFEALFGAPPSRKNTLLGSAATQAGQGIFSTEDFAVHVDRRLNDSTLAAPQTASARKAIKLTKKAFNAYHNHDFKKVLSLSFDATELDPTYPLGFFMLALGLEATGELHKALVTYEKALELDPSDTKVYFQLGNIARQLSMPEAAEKFYHLYIRLNPDDPVGYINLGNHYRDTDRFEDAIEILQMALWRHPEESSLWNILGTVAFEFGHLDEAHQFLHEAIRFAPDFARPYYNLGYQLNHTGPWDEALAYHEKALELTAENNPDRLEITHSRGFCHFSLGNLEQGFEDWETRRDASFSSAVLFAADCEPWDGEDLTGKRLLVMGEQGLGDELMFANALPDLVETMGSDENLMIACDERLVPLFKRRFPGAEVGRHYVATYRTKPVRFVPWAREGNTPDYFIPMGTTLKHYRKSIEDFPAAPLMTPNPDLATHWRERLNALGPGPFVGLCWRSLYVDVRRRKFFSPIELWEPILRTPGVKFINLQYGDASAEIALAAKRFGVEIVDFDDLDIKNDLESNAALCSQLDLVISAPTAAAALAGTIGTPVWLPVINRVWPSFGSDGFPAYPGSRCFLPAKHADWADTMGQVAEALTQLAQAASPSPAEQIA